jgi:hypothetical protein
LKNSRNRRRFGHLGSPRATVARRLQVGTAIGLIAASVLSGGAAFGIFSSLFSTQTDTFVAGQINPATNFAASSVTSTGATLSWTPATQPTGATITSVTITQSPTGGSGCTGLAVTATTCTLTGLSPSTTYTWTVNYFDNGWQAVTTTSATTQASGGTFGGLGAATCLTNSQNNAVVNYPTGAATGDLVILVVANNTNQLADFSQGGDSTGWTEVATPSGSGGPTTYPPGPSNNQRLQVFWHVVVAGETSVTLRMQTNSSGVCGWVIDYKGVPSPITQNPNPTTTFGSSTAATTLTPGTFTTAAANSLVLNFTEVTAATVTAPTLSTANGFTRDVGTTAQPAAGQPSMGLSVGSRNVAATGAVTSPTWSNTASVPWAYVTAAWT